MLGVSRVEQGLGHQGFIYFGAFDLCQVIDVCKMEGSGHAILHALGVAVAEVAFGGNASTPLKMDTAEWTGDNAHPATYAHRFIHGYGMRFGIALYCTRRTGQETGGCFTLLEVLVAMVILATAAVPILGGFHLATRNLETGRRYHTAVMIAQSRLSREVSAILNGRESDTPPPLPAGYTCNVTQAQKQGYVAVRVKVGFDVFGAQREYDLRSAVFAKN